MRAPILTTKRARAGRRKMTLPEVLLWNDLRRGRLGGLRFRRQHPVGPYILDFYLPSHCLAIEVDGRIHEHPDQAGHDLHRDNWLAEQGIRVMRFAARHVLDDEAREGILAAILEVAKGQES
jgi:very-short-patch-repair endonuclease